MCTQFKKWCMCRKSLDIGINFMTNKTDMILRNVYDFNASFMILFL